jgi:hypothetical protein
MLFEYSKMVRRMINDGALREIDEENVISYINRARREVAMRTQCIRFVPPITSALTRIDVTAPGSGYTAPIVTISPPDFPTGVQPYPPGAQATASASITAGHITGIQVTFGGAGYFQPTVTITDPTGKGATAVPVQTWMNLLHNQQEIYPLSAIDLSQFPGVGEVLFVRGVSIIYSNYRYSLPKYSFSSYQARIRQYPFQYTYVPTIFSQVGQGTAGTLYFYPLPSQTYQMEMDCTGIPQDLVNDFSEEAIPDPWTDAVPYFAAHLCYLQMQNFNAAEYYLNLYDKMASRYSYYSRPGRMISPYSRP